MRTLKILFLVSILGLIAVLLWAGQRRYDAEKEYAIKEKVVIQEREKVVLGYVQDMVVTCYSLVEFASQGKTASGYELQPGDGWLEKGRLIVASNSLPFGTKLKIEGFGDNVFEVQDRFAPGWNKAQLDIYWGDGIDAYRDCKKWGKNTLEVLILQDRDSVFAK